MIPQGVLAALAAVQQAHAIGRRAKNALAGGPLQGEMVMTSRTEHPELSVASETYQRAPAGSAGASVLGGIAGAAGTAAALGGKANRATAGTGAFMADPGRARVPWWLRATIWCMVLVYPFWTLAQVVPGQKMFPGAWLSPTFGQVFGFGDVPGYLGLEDLWRRINPTATTAPPAGWQPTDAEMRAVFATYDWSSTCAQAATTVTPAGTVTPVADDTGRSWVAQTFSALGTAMREEMLDPENLRDYGQWFYDGARTIVSVTVAAFNDHTADVAQATAYTAALTSFETGVRARCACPVVAAPPAVPVAALQLTKSAAQWGGHTNGQIPAPALMPLATARGQMLRADAAAAFDAMSRAYAAEMGRPIAVTDSYRSLAGQVAVKASKGHLAATPGTSNHGWALAVDLGGGIETFGTAQRAWMVANAGAYGWISPDWARQGGGREEPWHWEFTGGGNPAPATAAPAQAITCTPVPNQTVTIPAAVVTTGAV